ncbi:MAG: hypothetical protein JSW64_10400 [Candidatus Zixiibacteriota bacterium]|nr:MAG: hypothetical protein JSW64_10400 [candidate division Zixibacteria bacterium]
MNNYRKILIGFLSAVLAVYSCGGGSDKSGSADGPAAYFPEEIKEIHLLLSSKIRTFKGESLYEYINGGAEIYHLYNFVDVATASYKTGDIEIVLDIYRFENPDYAYGLYSSIKPLGPGNMELGVEGFSTENSIDFVKGKYIVRIVGFEQSDITKNALGELAIYLNEHLPGTTEMPPTFAIFPVENRIPGSEKIMAESFLGQIFLDDAYAVDYEIEGDEITLFVSEDSTGEKYLTWLEQVETEEFDPDGLAYDDQNSFLYNNEYYGYIVAGLVEGRLAGLIGYKESHREFLSRWLESLKNPE